jgi:histidinol-phosphatase (PHP family)
MNYFNFHTHSNFCDGTGEPEDYIKAALEKNFFSLGFSSHAPVPFKNNFAIKDEDELQQYCTLIRGLQLKYKEDIPVWLGLEIDYIDGISRDFGAFRKSCLLDYTIGSVHLVRNGNDEALWFIDGPRSASYDDGLQKVFGGDIRKAVSTYYDQVNRMLLSQKPDILGHFDKIKMHNKDRYFREDEAWYRRLVMDLLDVATQTGVIIEVNTRGIYKKRSDDLYPGQWVLKEINKRGLPVTISADAHRPEEIDGHYPETFAILKATGFKNLVCFTSGGWQEQALS